MFVYLQKLLHCLIIYSYKTYPLFLPCPWNLRSIGPSDLKFPWWPSWASRLISGRHQNPVKQSFAYHGGCYPWHGAPFNFPSDRIMSISRTVEWNIFTVPTAVNRHANIYMQVLTLVILSNRPVWLTQIFLHDLTWH